ncbi:uncharacterized protein [Leptinotarsa decemlineata]|uniref:uncharacterized protein n=1 Tax=Leptinotarsa decemlineata TaxID=7539 RepID=UPI003D30519E
MLRLLSVVGAILLVNSVLAVPFIPEDYPTEAIENIETTTVSNNTSEPTQNLYVIKSVVYEIGILTDAGNDTIAGNETHEEIDVSFFDPDSNGTLIDLSSIPIPIQTNISGVSITGIIPANFGSINLLEDGTPTLNGSHFPLLPNKQVKVSHNISTADRESSSSILSGLSDILGLKDLANIGQTNKTNPSEEKKESS